MPDVIGSLQSLDRGNSCGADGLARWVQSIPLGLIGESNDVPDIVSFLSAPGAVRDGALIPPEQKRSHVPRQTMGRFRLSTEHSAVPGARL